MKPLLVHRAENFCDIRSVFFWPHIKEYFDFEYYDPNKTYDRSSTIFLTQAIIKDTWLDGIKAQGYKTCIDSLYEPQIEFNDDHYLIQHPTTTWSLISCWMRYKNYHLYRPNKSLRFKGFMQSRMEKSHRNIIFERLGDRIQDWLYSVKGQGLPNDLIEDPENIFIIYYHPSWYDNSWFSMILESTVDGRVYTSEKTYKALSFYHPFLLLGVPGTLKHLRNWGFVTFDNLFDESYDQEPNLLKRIDLIIKNIDSLTYHDYDRETWMRLQHNHDLFYDETVVKQNIKIFVLEPLLEIVDA